MQDQPAPTPVVPASDAASPRLKIFGVGHAGAKIIAALAGRQSSDHQLFMVNTDPTAPAGSWQNILIGKKTTRGLGAGGEPERGRLAAEEDFARLAEACAGADLVILLAGMGGGIGTGAASVLARAAKQAGALVLAFVATPFEFEGHRRLRLAQAGVEHLKHEADAVVVVANEKMLHLVDEAATLEEGFAAANALLAEGVRSVARMLTSRGLIDVDFASLATVLRGRHTQSALAIADAAGPGRVKSVVEKLFAGPMFDRESLAAADSVLVNIVGGPDLKMTEVNRLMKELHAHCQKAHVVVGAALDAEFAQRLEVTLIVSGRAEDAGEESAPEAGDESAKAGSPSRIHDKEIGTEFLKKPEASPRRASRLVPGPPELSAEKREQLLAKHVRPTTRARRNGPKLQQQQLPLDIVSKGRFDKSEPTIHHGEDLDVPTFIRRGVVLN